MDIQQGQSDLGIERYNDRWPGGDRIVADSIDWVRRKYKTRKIGQVEPG